MKVQACQPGKIIAQLHRISGQVKAIEKMYLEERPVEEIIRVVFAARASLDGVAKNLIAAKLNGCYRGQTMLKRREVMDLIDTFFKHT